MSISSDPGAWAQTFLRGPGGNLGLADGLLLAPRFWRGPLALPLTHLPRCCGPEPAMAYRVPAEEFEARVGRLGAALDEGWVPPPLIVQFTGGVFVLTDGNHRREALGRRGLTETPCVVWGTGPEDEGDFDAAWGPWAEAEARAAEGLALGRELVVGALVTDPQGRIFSQRRSPQRKTFPGCWDLVGGHAEAGESPRAALVREVFEETGWTLDRVMGLRQVVDWETPGPGGRPVAKRELVFAVTVTGNLEAPLLEAGRVTEGRWFGPADLAVLQENRTGGDSYVYDLVRAELARGDRPWTA